MILPKKAHIMKPVWNMLLFVSLLPPCAVAQDELSLGDIFFGFSGLRANSSQTILTHTSLGGLGTLGWNVNEHIGIEAEIGGYHNGFVNAYHSDTNSVTYLFGPRFSYGRLRRFDPYFHILLGGIHTATSILNQPMTTQNSSRHSISEDGFSMAIGGGLDIRLHKYVSFRAAQLDYVPSMLSDIGIDGLTNKSFRSNFRFCVGFMFQDYEHW